MNSYYDEDEEFFKEAVEMKLPDDVEKASIRPPVERKLTPQMHPPRNNVFDALGSDVFASAMEGLKSEFDEWEVAEGRTNESLWGVLGSIYELAPKIAHNQNAHVKLLSMVNNVDGVSTSNRWRAETKHPQDLLLVVLLGFNDKTKSTRSHWRSALKAAAAMKVAPSRSAFVKWISEIGGIEGARQSVAKPRAATSTEQLATEVESFVDVEELPIRLPYRLTEEPLPKRFGLVLVREAGSETSGFPIATITNERVVRAALKAFLLEQKRIKKQEIAFAAEEKAQKRRILRAEWKKAKIEWKKQVKYWGCNDTQEEYFDLWLCERPELGLYDDWINREITL